MTLRPCVIDMSHGDASREEDGKLVCTADFAAAYAAGYRGVIHKVTEGSTFVDPLYSIRRTKAIAAGMLWGGYHFMKVGDVGDQASHYLTHASRGQGTTFMRHALDYEDEKSKLALWQAERWLEIIYNATRQRPWWYGGSLLREQTERRDPGLSVTQYPLWLAEYSTVARIPRPWQKYVLWQRSGDGEGPEPHSVPGIGHKVDIDWFDGDDQALKDAWYDMGAGPRTEVA
jgi:lysozyme